MDEIRERRKFVRKEAGQGSRVSGDQSMNIDVEDVEELSIVLRVEATSSMEEKFRSVLDATDDDGCQTPNTRIHKVPVVLLQHNEDLKKYFEPKVVSIGPYHHGNDDLKQAEKLKLKLTKEFIDKCCQPIEVVYTKIFGEIKKLRDCYDGEPTKNYDDKALAWMLFVDGCSVLRYIECYVAGKSTDLLIKHHDLAFMFQDLFLLENQLPFRVLELLMREGPQDNYGMKIIEEFVDMYIKTPERKDWKQWWGWQRQEEVLMEERPSHLLELFRKRLVGKSSSYVEKKDVQGNHWYPYRSVTELREAGIHLKPSVTNCLRDVGFKRGLIYGRLKLPPMIIDGSTRPKFLNLIAYEMSPGVINDLEVTSYVCFLNSLIDEASDVQLLRKAYIFHSVLSSDDDVAKLFNEIGTNLAANTRMYEGVKTGIQRQYNEFKSWKSFTAEFLHKHFRNPWTLFAFLWAIAIFLTQAYSKIVSLYHRFF